MDKTKKYIEMCERAEEIQENHTTVEFDIFYVDFSKSGWVNDNEICSAEYDYDSEGNGIWKIPYVEKGREYDKRDDGMSYIWLPRQDQLQEMIIGLPQCHGRVMKPLIECLVKFEEWFHNDEPKAEFNSMEQLWLAFVMKEKYKKTWDGRKWKK